MISPTLGPDKALGDFVALRTSNPAHFKGNGRIAGEKEESKSFAEMLQGGLADVNNKQQVFADLSVKAVTDPSSVDTHDLTIAMSEATMSLNIAKNVIDRVLRAYQTLTTLR